MPHYSTEFQIVLFVPLISLNQKYIVTLPPNKSIFVHPVFLLFCLLLTVGTLQAEEPKIGPGYQARLLCDSLNLLAKNTRYTYPDSTLAWGLRAKQAAELVGYKKGMEEACFNIGSAYYTLQKYDSSTRYLEVILSQPIGNTDSALYSSALTTKGILFLNTDRLDSCYYYFIRSLQIEIQRKDTLRLIRRYNNISGLYISTDNFLEASKSLNQAIRLANNLGDTNLIGALHNNLGKNYENIGDMDKALEHYQRCEELTDSLDYNNRIVLNMNLAKVLFSLGRYRESKEYDLKNYKLIKPDDTCNHVLIYAQQAEGEYQLGHLDTAQKLIEQVIQYGGQCYLSFSLSKTYLLLGKIMSKTGNRSKAKEYLKLANRHLHPANNTFTGRVHYDMSLLAEELGMYEVALEQYKQYQRIQDSALNRTNMLALARTEIQFDLEKMENNQKNRNQLLQARLDSSHRFRNILLISSIGLILLSYVLYGMYHKKERARRELERQKNTIESQKQELELKSQLLKNSYHKINELSEFKEKLAHMAVHDMKNPLNALIGLSEGEPDESKMHIIRKAGIQMLNFVSNMLDIYKFEQARIKLNLQWCNLGEVIYEAIQQVEFLMDEKQLHLEVEMEPGIQIKADSSILNRVLVNLLSNAIRHTPVNSTIHINCKVIGRQWQLSISDEGSGISRENLKQIFEPFKNKNLQAISSDSSTGIGLNFCLLAIQAHHGRIYAEQETEHGATITIVLPYQQSEGDEEKPDGFAYVNPASDELILDVEKQKIRIYARQLRKYRVHEIGLIREILEQMDVSGLKSRWIRKVRAAAFSGEEEIYHELLNKADE